MYNIFCRINFFRLSRIILDDIPEVLRDIFKAKISAKTGKRWQDNLQWGRWLLQWERFDSKLSKQQKQILESGNTQQWDSTLLSHVLLYSSHLLLANAILGQKVSIKDNSKKIFAVPSKKVDFRQCISSNDKILLDLGGPNFIRMEIASVSPNQITLKYPLRLPQGFPSTPLNCDAYVLSQDWNAVEFLSSLRNIMFAHIANARTTTSELNDVFQDVEAVYKDLKVPANCIQSMLDIKTGMYNNDTMVCTQYLHLSKMHSKILSLAL